MPAHLVGAIVDCYAAAPDFESALRLSVQQLVVDGYIFDDIEDGQVHHLAPDQWDAYIAETWPESRDCFPPQSDMPRFVAAGGVFFGPFVAWETE